jgi:hypothetical protein
MGETVTFRLDPETARILRALTRRRKQTKSAVIKDALRDTWQGRASESRPPSPAHGASQPQQTSWEIYLQLYRKLGPAPPGPKRDRARNVSRLLKGILLAKRRTGTL